MSSENIVFRHFTYNIFFIISQDVARGGSSSPREAPSSSNTGNASRSVDWVRRERLGKKGEFRYF